MRHPIARRAAGLALGALVTCSLPAKADSQMAVTHYGTLTYGIPIAVAFHGGMFAKTGAKVDGILTAPGGGTAVRNALASDLPVGESGLPSVIAARNSGLDLVIVYVAIGSLSDAAWVAKKGSQYNKLEDLAGAKVTYTNPKSGSETQLKHVLAKTGMADKVTLVASGGMREGLTMVETGAAAAAPIIEPMSTLMGAKFQTVFKAADHLPKAVQIVGFTTREFAEKNPDQVRAIIAARRMAIELMRSNPAEAAALAAKSYERVPPAALEAIIKRLNEDTDFYHLGGFDTQRFEAAEEELRLTEVTSGPVDWSKVLDDRFLPADQRMKK